MKSMKKVFRGTPKEIAKEVQEFLERLGVRESENNEAYSEILLEVLD